MTGVFARTGDGDTDTCRTEGRPREDTGQRRPPTNRGERPRNETPEAPLAARQVRTQEMTTAREPGGGPSQDTKPAAASTLHSSLHGCENETAVVCNTAVAGFVNSSRDWTGERAAGRRTAPSADARRSWCHLRPIIPGDFSAAAHLGDIPGRICEGDWSGRGWPSPLAGAEYIRRGCLLGSGTLDVTCCH